ncbi:magnesium chelatase accessory protein [Loktanella fryxellensis]|uniref:Magnesium chelatase accessory protein n=1 Tax=Loktanella fryxellensis TaxID=245187 RepID=A0A1H8CNU8_9RHOB|nr:alpha/beta fold hydrolase BchO [Loktanella fryxellensis]SEM96813.1 magnesium chelatase accessory protein [Loktanella fryxellensis]
MKWPPPADWPMRDASRHIMCKPHRWHVQDAGDGPLILLLHGAGGATHSWRGLFPLLTPDHRVIAVDQPGQGFTRAGTRGRRSLADTATDLIALCRQEGWVPDLIVGHSAGAALALQMARAGLSPRHGVVGINAALAPFGGAAGLLFPLMARAMAAAPLTARLFAATTTAQRIDRLLSGTGSVVPPEGRRDYLALASDTDHVDGTLSMMAQWALDDLADHLSEVAVPVLLLTASNDRAVPPATSIAAANRMPQGHHRDIGPLGHLAHEMDPTLLASLIRERLIA